MRDFLKTRRVGHLRLIFLLIGVVGLAACGASPKGKANEWANRFPPEIGNWELDDGRLELTAENQSNFGHVTLTYEGEEEAVAFVSIDVFATETAAEVEFARRVRDWELLGVRFEREKSARTATTAGGYLGLFQEDDVILTLSVIPPLVEPEETSAEPSFAPLPTDDIALLLETIEKVIKEST